jgi:hypothetical protein
MSTVYINVRLVWPLQELQPLVLSYYSLRARIIVVLEDGTNTNIKRK